MEPSLIQRLVGGTAVGYMEYGDPAGFPLIFHHGWPGSHYQGRLLHEPALRMGIRVVAIDRPGIGDSTPQNGATVMDTIQNVLELADTRHMDRFHVLGVSGGGPYALAMAALAPDRVRGVGVCCGAPPLSLLTDAHALHPMYRAMMSMDHLAPVLSDGVMTMLGWMLWAVPQPANLFPLMAVLPRPDRRVLAVKANQDILLESMKTAFKRGAAPLIADARRIRAPWGFSLESIASSVIFWHGGMDRNIPLETARVMIRRVCRSITHVYASEGHYSLPMNRAEDFLSHLSQVP